MRKQPVAQVSFILGLIFILGGAPRVMADPILRFNPPTQTVTPGQTFNVDVFIASVTDLYSFVFDLNFNSTVLSANSVAEGSFFSTGSLFFIPLASNPPGVIAFIFNSLSGLVPGVSGSGPLVTINFTAANLGTSGLTLSKVELVDSQINFISFTTESGSVTVVPEPATLVLLATGLLGFFAYGKRRFQRQ